MGLQWDDKAWEEYLDWQTQDKKTIKKINMLIQEIQRNSFTGIGKPEPLKGSEHGAWSRHIDEKNRLIYYKEGDVVFILSVVVTMMTNEQTKENL